MTQVPPHDEHDEYLWTGAGAVSLDVARLERDLRPLAWQARALPIPEVPEPALAAPVLALRSPAPARAARADRPRPWLVPLGAGLLAAAAVLTVVVWQRQAERTADPVTRPSTRPDAPAAQPAGRPGAPDLRDPFAGSAPTPPPPTPPARAAELHDPFRSGRAPAPTPAPAPAPAPAGDLIDPFASQAASNTPAPPVPVPQPEPEPHADLVDPFASERDAPSAKPAAGELYDPFRGAPGKRSRENSPDLSDPFGR